MTPGSPAGCGRTVGGTVHGMTTDASGFDPDNPPLQILEDDETVPPRPEEELADVERSEPDPH